MYSGSVWAELGINLVFFLPQGAPRTSTPLPPTNPPTQPPTPTLPPRGARQDIVFVRIQYRRQSWHRGEGLAPRTVGLHSPGKGGRGAKEPGLVL